LHQSSDDMCLMVQLLPQVGVFVAELRNQGRTLRVLTGRGPGGRLGRGARRAT
jgi:hypothetical protein